MSSVAKSCHTRMTIQNGHGSGTFRLSPEQGTELSNNEAQDCSRFLLAGLAALLLGLTGCATRTATQTEYPVRLVGQVHWPAGQTLEQLKDTPISQLGPDSPESIRMTQAGLPWDTPTDDSNTVTVQTWREFRHYTDLGYELTSNLDLKFSSWLTAHRGFIPFLERAIPSRQSGVGDLRMNRRLLWRLPLDLGMAISNEQVEAREAAQQQGLTWTEHWPETRLNKAGRHSMLLESEMGLVHLSVVAYGDYNHDGWEDVMLCVTHQTRGTLSYTFNTILTQTAPEGPLRTIEW